MSTARQVMEKANQMAQYDDIDMDIRSMRETIKPNQNALHGSICKQQ